MVLIDRIIDIDHGKSLTAIKNVTINEPYFAGHFPSQPIMPAVLIFREYGASGCISCFK